MKRLWTHGMVMGAMMTATVAAGTNPTLLFTREQVPGIRERIQHEPYARVWNDYLAGAERMLAEAEPMDPAMDPGQGGRDPAKAKRLLGHRVGRSLSNWMEALGIAYHVTGEERFGRKGAALLYASAEGFPVTQEWMALGFAGGRGDFMRGLALGYDLFHDQLTAPQRQVVRQVADGYIKHFLETANNPDTWWYGVHNFNGVCGGAAGMLCLALEASDPETYSSQALQCAGVIQRWLDTSFDEQGAYSEGVGYSQYGLSNSLLFARVLKQRGDMDLFSHPNLRKAPVFYAMSLLPGEAFMDARNDSNYGRVNLECLLLAIENRDGLAKWLYSLRGSPQAPWDILFDADAVLATDPAQAGLPLAMHFEGRGLCVWRTGWQRDDIMLSVEAGPYFPVTHNQGDKGHFTLYGLGQRWAVDPGYGNDRQFPLSRCHTLAHNCILIDGKGQAPSGSGLGTDGTILRFDAHEHHALAVADCTAAYNTNNRGQPGAVVQRALRYVLFVKPSHGIPAYAVVLDDIRKDEEPHEMVWQMLTWPTMQVDIDGAGFALRPRSTIGKAFLTTPAEAEGGGKAVWTLSVDTPGTYELWGRVRATGEELGKSDSFFVQVGDGDRLSWHMPTSANWIWGRVGEGVPAEPRTFALEPGPLAITLETREPEAQLDMLALVPEGADRPTDQAIPEQAVTAREARVSGTMTVVEEAPETSRLVGLVYAAAGNPGIALDLYTPEDGRSPATYPRLRAGRAAVNPRFVSLLLPLPADTPQPEVEVDYRDEGALVRVAWPSAEDRLQWTFSAPEHDGITFTRQP